MNQKLIFFAFFLLILLSFNKIGIINYKNRGICNLGIILYSSLFFYLIIKEDDDRTN